MVRNYKRKSDKASWDPATVQQAVHLIRSGTMSARGASIKFGIPRGTLRDRVRKNVTASVVPHLGRKCALGDDFERELRDFVVELQRRSFCMDTVTLRKLAYDIAEKNGFSHPFSAKTRRAGKDWCQGFLRRHPDLEVRRPDSVSMAEMLGFSETKMRDCLALLMQIYAQNAVVLEDSEDDDDGTMVRTHAAPTSSGHLAEPLRREAEPVSLRLGPGTSTVKREVEVDEDLWSGALQLLADNAVVARRVPETEESILPTLEG